MALLLVESTQPSHLGSHRSFYRTSVMVIVVCHRLHRVHPFHRRRVLLLTMTPVGRPLSLVVVARLICTMRLDVVATVALGAAPGHPL